jgi:hypothetical protein
MMGEKKLTTIRAELHAALAKEKKNPIAALERRIRQLGKANRSLLLVRDALEQLVEKPSKPKRAKTRRAKSVTS